MGIPGRAAVNRCAVSSPISNMPYLHPRGSNSQTSVGSSTLPPESVPRSATFQPLTRAMNDSNVSIDSSTNTLQAQMPLPIPRSALTFQPTPRAMTESAHSLHSLNHKWAGTIVYLISSSNWNAVLTRVRTKIHSLISDVDILEAGDLSLIHHCAMDRGRLIQLLQGNCFRRCFRVVTCSLTVLCVFFCLEMASLLINMKKEA